MTNPPVAPRSAVVVRYDDPDLSDLDTRTFEGAGHVADVDVYCCATYRGAEFVCLSRRADGIVVDVLPGGRARVYPAGATLRLAGDCGFVRTCYLEPEERLLVPVADLLGPARAFAARGACDVAALNEALADAVRVGRAFNDLDETGTDDETEDDDTPTVADLDRLAVELAMVAKLVDRARAALMRARSAAEDAEADDPLAALADELPASTPLDADGDAWPACLHRAASARRARHHTEAVEMEMAAIVTLLTGSRPHWVVELAEGDRA